MALPEVHWFQRDSSSIRPSALISDMSTSLFPHPAPSNLGRYESLTLEDDIVGLVGTEHNVCGDSNVSPQQVFGPQLSYPEVSQQVMSGLDDQSCQAVTNFSERPKAIADARLDWIEETLHSGTTRRDRTEIDVDTLMRVIQVQTGEAMLPGHHTKADGVCSGKSSSKSSSTDVDSEQASKQSKQSLDQKKTFLQSAVMRQDVHAKDSP